jgi:hypothetical protein
MLIGILHDLQIVAGIQYRCSYRRRTIVHIKFTAIVFGSFRWPHDPELVNCASLTYQCIDIVSLTLEELDDSRRTVLDTLMISLS